MYYGPSSRLGPPDRGYAKAERPMRCWSDPAREKMRDGSEGEDPCPTFGTPYDKRGLVRIGRKCSKSTVRHQGRYSRRPRHPEGYPGLHPPQTPGTTNQTCP